MNKAKIPQIQLFFQRKVLPWFLYFLIINDLLVIFVRYGAPKVSIEKKSKKINHVYLRKSKPEEAIISYDKVTGKVLYGYPNNVTYTFLGYKPTRRQTDEAYLQSRSADGKVITQKCEKITEYLNPSDRLSGSTRIKPDNELFESAKRFYGWKESEA